MSAITAELLEAEVEAREVAIERVKTRRYNFAHEFEYAGVELRRLKAQIEVLNALLRVLDS